RFGGRRRVLAIRLRAATRVGARRDAAARARGEVGVAFVLAAGIARARRARRERRFAVREARPGCVDAGLLAHRAALGAGLRVLIGAVDRVARAESEKERDPQNVPSSKRPPIVGTTRTLVCGGGGSSWWVLSAAVMIVAMAPAPATAKPI